MGFIAGKRFVEIRAHPFAQVFGLAYIDDVTRLIKVFINAWLLGHRGNNLSEIFLRHITGA
jgi:hypothetical protein